MFQGMVSLVIEVGKADDSSMCVNTTVFLPEGAKKRTFQARSSQLHKCGEMISWEVLECYKTSSQLSPFALGGG